VQQVGNKVVCDALMRMARRNRKVEDMKNLAVQMVTAGFTNCEVANWGHENGFDEMGEAVGIQDLSKC
jgi:hypothetical protein